MPGQKNSRTNTSDARDAIRARASLDRTKEMKLTTNEIRAILLRSDAFKKHLELLAASQEAQCIALALTDLYFTPSACKKIQDSHTEIALHMLAELIYVLQWKEDFDLNATVDFYVNFNAAKIAQDGSYPQ